MQVKSPPPENRPKNSLNLESGYKSVNGRIAECEENQKIRPVSRMQQEDLLKPIALEFEAPERDTLGFRISQIPSVNFQISTTTLTLDQAERYILNVHNTDHNYVGFKPPKNGDDYSILLFPPVSRIREVIYDFEQLRDSYEEKARFLIGVNRNCSVFDGGRLKRGNFYTILPAK